MTDSITIVLDLPHKNLSPNARCHWAAKADKVKAYRYAAYLGARRVMHQTIDPFRWERATAKCVFFVKDKRGLKSDRDNRLASMKAAFDGITDAGVLVNDRGLTHEPVEVLVDAESPRVQVTIRRLP